MLQTKEFVKREHHSFISSTQDRAKEVANNLTIPEWHLITADAQTKARGTHGRNWLSPPDVNLYATFVFPIPSDKAALIINIPQVIAYAVFETLREYDLHPKLKWINDILLKNKKVSGVLCETENSRALGNHCMVLAGIGINVNMDTTACASLDLPATSLMLELGHLVDKEEILTKLTSHITANIQRLIQNGFSSFVPDILENLAFRGEKIKIQLDDIEKTVKEGIFVGINDQGMLLLQSGDKTETLFLGKIIWHS
jgi:BirA family biotin operon repressor/biotin-[acetyl-CoA-carboxylase] ligase